MKRMHFDARIDREEYGHLFRLMSPVLTEYWTMPGNPPTLQHRADFSDFQYNDLLRSRREIVKGRFQNGGIAYVYFDELEIFAALYRKPIHAFSPKDQEILSLIEHEGPINVKGMKEVLNRYVKDITPILHRLQQAFIVFEDQRSTEWDRGWYLFEREFPELDLSKYSFEAALKIVLKRCLHLLVWVTPKMVENIYKLPSKKIQKICDEGVESKTLVPYEINNTLGYMSIEDWQILQNEGLQTVPTSIFCLNRNDYFVKAMEEELKTRFPKTTCDVMYYLLHQGIFKGAVYGYFKIGPNIIWDVIFDQDIETMTIMKKEVIKAIGKVAHLDESPILHYMGVKEHE
jgi:hypothetical protein